MHRFNCDDGKLEKACLGAEKARHKKELDCSDVTEMGAVRLELTKAEAEGFTVPCNCHYATPPKGKRRMLAKGLEPSTVRLQGGCSTIELHQH